ncbi:MAG: right-handed parallel beta-helix repeat-containing protein [Planctomycetota bacterium]|jgi:hypothetical protein
MRLPGTSWYDTTAAIIALAAVCFAPCAVRADGPYEYDDDFKEDFAESHSYLHSVFWPQGAFPPPEPYLYFLGSGEQRELGFGDHHGELAYLGYRFPTGPLQPERALSGNLQVDVRSPYDGDVTSSLAGRLLYRISADGVNWSGSQELLPGSHDIPIASVRGSCYIEFFGTEVLIDNLRVQLFTPATTINVPGDFSTIQAAIDAASDGDVVQVAPGTYSGSGNRNIDFAGKAITVRSRSGPDNTTIDCTGHRGFYFHTEEGSDSVLRGFTIIGGRRQGSDIPPEGESWDPSADHPIGGGIYCELASPTIINCVIEECEAAVGGGIGLVGGTPTISDCVIEGCRAGRAGAGIGLIGGCDATIINCTSKNNVAGGGSLGAGLYCRQSTAFLVDCDVSRNSAEGNVKGGGLYCGGSSGGLVAENCLIADNTAEAGGGVFAEEFDYVRLTNCTIAGNRISAPGTSPGGGIHSVDGDIVIRNSIVWHNDATPILLVDEVSANPVLFSNVEGSYSGQGNIDADPSFASPTMGDYHLKSVVGRYDPRWDDWSEDFLDYHSPCIDAGDPQDPVGSEPFPNSNRINMGAYGGTAEASKSFGPMIWHVDGANGHDFNKGLSRITAFATIQRALADDVAQDGDTVLVWPGVYREEVAFKRKAITLQSADEAAVVAAPSGYAFSFYGAESSRSVLRNFVITNCSDEGAIYSESASPALTNLTIVGNQFGVKAFGGADPSITSCIFWDNRDGDLLQCRAHFSRLQVLLPLDVENGNIDAEPFFADPAGGDYHLQSRYGRYSPGGKWVTDALTSDCIDAGDPAVYPARERMPRGGQVNMGAYGGTPFASLSGGQSWDQMNLSARPGPTE